MLVLVGNTNVTPRENARNIKFKKTQKTLDTKPLCFYDFLRGVFAARFSGERRQGRDIFWGFLDRRSLDASCLCRGLGRLADPQSLGFFQMTGFFQKLVVVACESL